MNTLKFEVYKNTLKRRDGFNPVLGEKNYTKIKCYFAESDWDKCTAVTANFIASKDNIVKSTVSLTADDKTAVFDIPSELEGDKVYFSLTGSYADDSGNTVTLNTNIVGIDRQKGMLPQDKVNVQLFEQLVTLINDYSSQLNAKVLNILNEIVTARDTFDNLGERLNNLIPDEVNVITTDHMRDGSVKTNKIADAAVTASKLSRDLLTLINSVVNKANTADVEKLLALKANTSDVDTALAKKASTTEVNELLALKSDKATTLAGYGITDGIKNAAGTVRAVNLAYDVEKKFDEKVNSDELLDVTKSINLANLADYSAKQNGVTVTVNKGKISLVGTSTAAINLFLPLKSPITLQANKPYCLSLQDFTTNNTGCMFYPAHGQAVIGSKWLLSELSAIKNAVATYTPTQDTVIDSIKIAIATGRLTTNSCYLQIEQNNQKTAYVDPDKIVKKVKPTLYQGPDYAMHYLYVANDYNEDTEGYGETKFNSILSANNSIADNSYHNRYTIVVMAGTYTDLQDKYAGMSDVGLIGYRGVMTKDYVFYESENIYNPAATVIKWDGATGFDKSILKSEDIIKKCPFHLDLNVHTHIRGFTFDCKNIRYGMHLESGGTGYATNWVVGQCTFIWGGRADCVDYANKTTVPVFGCGHSFGEVGLIEDCKIIPTHCTVGYQNHENADNSDFGGLPIKVGAKITLKDCDFGGTEIQARTLKGAYADTPNVLTLDNCINISAVNKMYAAPADHCDWVIKGAD